MQIDWFGEYVLDDEDFKEVAKKVWKDDKKAIIEYTIKSYTEQGEKVNIPEFITFEEFYREYDPCMFQDYDVENWKYWEEQYISDWKYEHNLEV